MKLLWEWPKLIYQITVFQVPRLVYFSSNEVISLSAPSPLLINLWPSGSGEWEWWRCSLKSWAVIVLRKWHEVYIPCKVRLNVPFLIPSSHGSVRYKCLLGVPWVVPVSPQSPERVIPYKTSISDTDSTIHNVSKQCNVIHCLAKSVKLFESKTNNGG